MSTTTFDAVRRHRWCVLAIGFCVLALSAAGCGGGSTTSSSTIPELTRAADGSYYAQVKDAKAANAACAKKNQDELGKELKKLGAGGATTTPGPLGYGSQVQNATGIVAVAFRYGEPTAGGQVQATVCMVRVPK